MKEIASPRPRVGIRNDEFYFVNNPERETGLVFQIAYLINTAGPFIAAC
jgi:hypothetical protein